MSERTARPEREQGCPDGIETCVVHRLVRQGTPEPSEEESLRLVAVRILERNALRDYFDFATLAVRALQPFDRLYPLKNGESALQQLLVQLAHAIPYDAPENDAYWQNVKAACAHAWQSCSLTGYATPTQRSARVRGVWGKRIRKNPNRA
ncbi:MAG: hypothetical protein PHF02_05030 [Tepidiphilus sp.]|nr:hypothetical protein [Tepidiphilus sp.]